MQSALLRRGGWLPKPPVYDALGMLVRRCVLCVLVLGCSFVACRAASAQRTCGWCKNNIVAVYCALLRCGAWLPEPPVHDACVMLVRCLQLSCCLLHSRSAGV